MVVAVAGTSGPPISGVSIHRAGISEGVELESGGSMSVRSTSDESSGGRKSSRDQLRNAVTSKFGSEAVALLFAGIAAYEPVRRLIEPHEPPRDGESGSETGDVPPGSEPADDFVAEFFYYEEWTLEPLAPGLDWSDGSIDNTFVDPFTASSSWYDDVDSGSAPDVDGLSGVDSVFDPGASAGDDLSGGDWL